MTILEYVGLALLILGTILVFAARTQNVLDLPLILAGDVLLGVNDVLENRPYWSILFFGLAIFVAYRLIVVTKARRAQGAQ